MAMSTEVGHPFTVLLMRFLGGTMGRTVLPVSQILQREYEEWKKFRRALRKEDQEAFDRLFDRAKLHVQAAAYTSRPWPLESILLSICLEHEKLLTEILRKLKERQETNGH
jgi:hypothetical protein